MCTEGSGTEFQIGLICLTASRVREIVLSGYVCRGIHTRDTVVCTLMLYNDGSRVRRWSGYPLQAW